MAQIRITQRVGYNLIKSVIKKILTPCPLTLVLNILTLGAMTTYYLSLILLTMLMSVLALNASKSKDVRVRVRIRKNRQKYE